MLRMLRAAVCALLMVSALAPAALAQLPQETEDLQDPQDIQVEDLLDAQNRRDIQVEDILDPETPAEAPVAVTLQASELSQRAFVLVFDYPVGGLRQEEEVTAAVESWISSKLQPADLVAVASYYGSELQIQQDFTTERGILAVAVADAVKGRPRESAQASPGTPSLLSRFPQGEELRLRTTSFYGVLQVLAEASDGVAGRKDLLVFSKGFGRSRASDEMVAAPDLGLAEKYVSDRDLYEPTLQALKLHEVALYPVDLATDYRETYPLAGVMSQLAADSGGRYLYPADDLPKLFSRILEDGPRPQKPAEDQRAAGAAGRRDASKSGDE